MMPGYSHFSHIRKYPLISLILLLQASIFSYYLFQFLNTDLWNDEIYTLKYFTFTPFSTTLFDYHTPNNHVFFNLVNNLYLKLTGISFNDLLDHPWKIRIVSLAYTLVSIFMCWKISKKFYGEKSALFSIILLLSTIPYLNYAVQVRSYAMGTMFLSLIIYQVLSFRSDKKSLRLVLISIFTSLLMYCNPANAYFAGSLILIFGFKWIYYRKKDIAASASSMRVLMSLSIGLLVALICFLPIFKKVFFNEFARYRDISLFYAIEFTFQQLEYFITYRWYFLLILFILVVYQWRQYKEIRIKDFYFFTTLLILPFVLFSIRGDRPPERIFTVLIPFFATYLAINFEAFLKEFEAKPFSKLLPSLFMAGSAACFLLGIFIVKRQLQWDLMHGGRSQDNFYNYYQHYFHPNQEVMRLKKIYHTQNSVVIVAGGEPYDLPLYLAKEHIPYLDVNYLDSINAFKGKKIFVFSTYTNELKHKLGKSCPECEIGILSKEISYHNLVEIKIPGDTIIEK